MNKLEKDFKLFCKDRGLSSMTVDDITKYQASYVPYILEERQLNVQSLDIYSRMMYDRILFMRGEFDEDSCNMLTSQLLYLNSVDERPIDIYINSGGGSIVDGLQVIDTMNIINPKVNTTCLGMAASMGAVLLSCGDKRYCLPHSRVMLHEAASSMRGKTHDITVRYEQLLRCQKEIYELLAKNLGKTYEEIEQLCVNTDKWFIGEEAVELGIVDEILKKNKD